MHQIVFYFLVLAAILSVGLASYDSPRFLRNQPRSVQQGYYAIANNTQLSLNQKQMELRQWAQEHNLLNQYITFDQKQSQQEVQMNQSTDRIISQLPSVKSQLKAILDQDNLTGAQIQQAVGQLAGRYPQQIATLMFIREDIQKQFTEDY